RNFSSWGYVEIVFGEIDAGFEKRDELDKRSLDRSDAARKRAPHLAGRLTRLSESLGFNEVAHSLSLRQIDAAGNKRALRKLAGFGKSCAQLDGTSKQKFQHGRRPMGGNLHYILAGVGVGRLKEGHHGFIDARGGGFGVVEDISQACAGVLKRMAKPNELRGYGSRLWPAEAHNSDPAAAGRSGYRGYGFAC